MKENNGEANRIEGKRQQNAKNKNGSDDCASKRIQVASQAPIYFMLWVERLSKQKKKQIAKHFLFLRSK